MKISECKGKIKKYNKNRMEELKLSEYPKRGLSYIQVKDETKLVEYRKKNKIKQICSECKNNTFFIDTIGIEHCSKCFYPNGIIF